MKNLALIILALITLNCENEEVCTCEKETYRVNTVQLENGNLVSEFPVLVKTEKVSCRDEEVVTVSDSEYYVIICE